MTTVSEFLKKGGFLYPTTKGLEDYDFVNNQVGFDDDPNNVASGEATIIYAGPPVFMNSGNGDYSAVDFGKLLVPIGAVQGFSDSEQPAVQPFPEIGSRLKRYAVGMATYQIQMSKVLTYFDNLRHACYAWIPNLKGDQPTEFLFAPGEEAGTAGHSHFTNMESDLMRVPFGILLATVTAGGNVISKEYYEKCLFGSAGKSVQAGSAIIQEQVAITVTRKVPANGLKIGSQQKLVTFNIGAGNDKVIT